MKARGKREARRPWILCIYERRPEGPKYFALSGLGRLMFSTRGDALRACPWLSYLAPLALHPDTGDALCIDRRHPRITGGKSVFHVSEHVFRMSRVYTPFALAPGFHIPRLWRLPLIT
jgi:hypothetical protein